MGKCGTNVVGCDGSHGFKQRDIEAPILINIQQELSEE